MKNSTTEILNSRHDLQFVYSDPVGFVTMVPVVAGDTLNLEAAGNDWLKASFSIAVLPTLSVTSRPGFSATKSTGSGASGSVIAGWTSEFDNAGMLNVTTGIITIPKTGIWHIVFFGVDDGPVENNDGAQLKIFVDDVAVGVGAGMQVQTFQAGAAVMSLSIALNLSKDQTVKFTQNWTGTTMGPFVSNRMGAWFVGPSS